MIQLHDKYINIGVRAEYNNNLSDIILETIDLATYSLLFDLGNSRSYCRKKIDVDDLCTSLELSSRYPLIIFTQLPCKFNLCGNRNFLAWNGNDSQDFKMKNIIKEIEYELYTISKLGGSVISQLGAFMDKNKGIDSCIKSINNINFKLDYKLILINSLNEYHNIGITLQDLFTIYDRLDMNSKEYVNIGLNLEYFMINNLYDFSKPSEVKKLFKDFDKLFNFLHRTSKKDSLKKDSLNTTNMNNNSIQLYPKIILFGDFEFWKENNDSLREVLCYSKTNNVSIIIDTVEDLNNVREYIYKLKKIIK
jgi:hypothetical protein